MSTSVTQDKFNPVEAFKNLPEISIEVRRRKTWRGGEEVMSISTCYYCWQYRSAPAGMFILLSTEYSLTPITCPSPSLHYSPSDDSLNTKVLTLADCGYCDGKVVVRL